MAFSFSTPLQQQPLFQTPAAQTPQQQPFQFPQSTPSPFQQQQQQQQSAFQFQPQMQQTQPQFHQQPQPQPQPQQQQIVLYTVDKAPASYNTKWAELHPDSQKFLLQIEERILEYRDESQRLDQCSRLYDSSFSNDRFELDAIYILQELGGISTAMEREKHLIQEQMAAVNSLMRDAEVAVHSFMILRQRFLHSNVVSGTATGTATSQSTGTATAPNPSSQSVNNTIQVFDFYNGLPKRPSPFLQRTVIRFEKYLAECYQWVEELEQLLRLDADGTTSCSGTLTLQSLPNIMSNVHDFFVHVAAKVESLHQRIESMKMAYLADQRRRGDWNDPFLEADRRQTARQEAAAKRVHPTLHLPAVPSQPSTQIAGPSSAASGPSNVSQLSLATPGASSAASFSLFTPSSSSMPSSSLFSTPSTPAPTSTLIGSSGILHQTTPFGSASSSLFGSAQTSLFGTSTPSFATPGIGSSPAFATPFPSGAATGSGASFSGTSKSAKPKSRTARR